MMDIVTGKTRPDEGDVLFDGGKHDLTKLDETAIAELGIGRKFQKPTVFESHTVADNILLALKVRAGHSPPCSAGATRCTPTRSTRSSRSPACSIIATGSPAKFHMARSNGWKSACCSRRILPFSLSTSPLRE